MYQQERHTALQHLSWNKDIVIDTIKSGIKSINSNRDKITGLWSIHPNDQFGNAPKYLTDFYMGAAGNIWALNKLNHFYKCLDPKIFKQLIDLTLTEHRKLDGHTPYDDSASYFCGLAGVLLIKHFISPKDEYELELIKLIECKINSLENEILYGLPGSLLMLNFLENYSINPEMIKLKLKVIDKILNSRILDKDSEALIWEQTFTNKVRYLGAAHGSIGNYSVLLKALKCNPNNKLRSDIILNIEKLLTYYAIIEKDKCNWPNLINSLNPKYLIHWCHGATGIITELATEIKSNESILIDELIVKAGNLVWSAGPLEKGTSICHGTSGSGMACLKLYNRTMDSVWLDRAKLLAMHTIAQNKMEVEKFGQSRNSLWTGDLGFLWYLHCTLEEKALMPGLDIL